jgi:hypothetical protein
LISKAFLCMGGAGILREFRGTDLKGSNKFLTPKRNKQIKIALYNLISESRFVYYYKSSTK